MSAADRVLRPLREAESSVGVLESYTSPAALAAALSDVRNAAERTLRLLLRESRVAPDAGRLRALAPDYPVEEVITALRRGNVLSMELAGRLHALLAAAERAARGDVRAADGDAASATVVQLRAEAAAALPSANAAALDSGSSAEAPAPDAHVSGTPAAPAHGFRGRAAVDPAFRSRLRWLAAALMLGVATLVAVQLFRDAPDAMAEGVAAFQEERYGVAEQAFRAVVAAEPDHITAWLYLGRIMRIQGRHDQAADALERAVSLAPEDAAVQRELGYLFMDLSRPEQAAARFDRARELDPANTASWIGFIRALRAAGDPAAEVWLGRAPAEVKAALGGTSPPTS